MKKPPKQTPFLQQSEAGAIWDRLHEKSPYFLSAVLCLTEKCNLTCPHCLLVPPRKEDRLSLPEIETLFDEMAQLGVLSLNLTGGEPALLGNLEAIVAAATTRRFWVTMKTNGTLLDEKAMEALFEAGLAQIDFSLYSDKAHEHDEFVCLPHAWERTVAAARKLLSLGGRPQMSICAFNWNWKQVGKIIDFCQKQGFAYSVASAITCRNDGDLEPTKFRTSEETRKLLFNDPRLLDTYKGENQNAKISESKLCKASQSIQIQPNGDVKLCQRLPWVLGNVRQTGIREIWDRSSKRQEFTSLRWRDLPKCSSCDIAWACGRCPATALLENGSILAAAKDDCKTARAIADLCNGKGSIYHRCP